MKTKVVTVEFRYNKYIPSNVIDGYLDKSVELGDDVVTKTGKKSVYVETDPNMTPSEFHVRVYNALDTLVRANVNHSEPLDGYQMVILNVSDMN